MNTIKIDDREYNVEELNDDAKSHITHLRVCDERIQQLQRELGITQTARNVYAQALSECLPKEE